MPLSETAQERVVIAFLERFLADRERHETASLEEYLRRFPGAEQRIAVEFASVTDASDSVRRGQSGRRVGAYELLRLLGRGGQGEVYEARDERFGRLVALKVLPRALGLDNGRLPAQLARELEALSRLDHPGICVVYDAGESDGRAYLAMRLVRGESLAEYVAGIHEGAPRVRAVVMLIEKTARALQAAHEAGVVHRDVKPSNVMVNESGEPVILDFGLARAEDAESFSFTLTGDLIGTPRYLAPERLRGESRADPRGDVWSLGITLYELLTGTVPFDGPSFESVARRVTHEEFEDPCKRQPAIPKDLRAVLSAALEKDPARRYASMAAFADDLARVNRGEAVQARPLTPVRRAARWMRRNPTPTALLLLLAFGLGAALVTARQYSALADRNAANLRRADAQLARANLEEARLLAGTARHDRAERMLELGRSAAAARLRSEDETGAMPAEAPSLAALRSMCMDALQSSSARLAAEFPRTESVMGSYSSNGTWLGERLIAPGENRLLVKELRIVRASDGIVVARSSHADLLDAEEGMAVGNDGRTLAVIGPGERSVELWDLVNDSHVQSFALPVDLIMRERGPTTRRKWTLAFDPTGTHLAAAVAPTEHDNSQPTPRGYALWRVADGERLAGEATGTYRHAWLAFSPDGAWLAYLRDERQVGIIRLAAEGEVAGQALNLPEPVWAGAIGSGDPPRLVFVVGERMDSAHSLWVLPLGRPQTELTAPIGAPVEVGNATGLQLDPGESRLAFADQQYGVRVIDLQHGNEVLHIAGAHPANLDALRWTADGSHLLSHGRGGDARVWEPRASHGFSESYEIPKPSDLGGILSFAPDLSRVAYIHPLEPQHVWSWLPGQVRETWQRLADPFPEGAVPTVYQVSVSSGGERVARIARSRVTLWDLVSGDTESMDAEVGDDYMGGHFDQSGSFHVLERTATGYSRLTMPGRMRTPLVGIDREAWAEQSPDGRRLLRERASESAQILSVIEIESGELLPLEPDPAMPAVSTRGMQWSSWTLDRRMGEHSRLPIHHLGCVYRCASLHE